METGLSHQENESEEALGCAELHTEGCVSMPSGNYRHNPRAFMAKISLYLSQLFFWGQNLSVLLLPVRGQGWGL
jgi:hypothetical protein